MKIWIPISIVSALACAGGASTALAQPRPPIPTHDDHRAGPDPRRDPRDDHKNPPDARRDEREEHKEAVEAHRDAEAEAREHFLQLQNQDRQRRDAARRDQKVWAASRQQRAEEHRKEITATWGNLANNAEAKAELNLHADRMSRLNRVIDLAEDRNEPTVVARAKVLVEREIARDARVLQAIKAKGGTR